MKNFAGKIVYVTGGSSGIGLAASRLFFERGADVLVCARNEERLEAACREIEAVRKNPSARVAYRVLDVSDHEAVSRVMTEAVSQFGPPDILLNCAGRAYPKYVERIDYSQFDETMHINLYGVWNTVHTLLPLLKERHGYIVNTSSMAGFIGVFGYTDYSASKFGVVGFSEALRMEMKPYGVRVSVLCPPDTDTPGFQTENRTKPPETVAVSQGAKIMRPDQVAEELLKGMERERFMIIPGADGKFSFFMKRLFPSLVFSILDGQVRKAREKKTEKGAKE